MANVMIRALSVIVGLLFLFTGTLKIARFNEEIHNEMVKNFNRSADVFPFADRTGFKPDPELFRKVIGTCEVVCGLILAFVPGSLKLIADMILMVIMVGAVYTHYALKDKPMMMVPASVLFVLLFVHYVVSRRSGREHTVVQAQGTKKKAQ